MTDALRGKISLLIHLANADGHFDIKEKAFIYNVCLRQGIDLDTIGDMIEKPDPVSDLANLPEAVRIDYLIDSLLLIMVDGVILPREMTFFYQIGRQLNFSQLLLDKLVSEIREQPATTYEMLHQRLEHYNKIAH